MKYDGYRLLVAVGGVEARAYTHSGLDGSEKPDAIVQAAVKLDVGSALLDGEAVVLDGSGRSGSQALQGALKGAPATIDYHAFDLLELDGVDLTGLPMTERKASCAGYCPMAIPASAIRSTLSAMARSCFTTSVMQVSKGHFEAS